MSSSIDNLHSLSPQNACPGQIFALRLYLDMMIHDLYGYNETTQFFAKLIANRFSGLEHLFPPSEDDADICSAAVSGKIPTCIHMHGYAKLDMAVVGSHFEVLSPEVRDILFQVLCPTSTSISI